MTFEIKHGDNIEILKYYPNNHFDSIVTDAPYGLGREQDPEKVLKEWLTHGYYEIKGKGFMGKAWDAFVPQPVFWKECIRVLKPGGHLLCFFGTRTYDWGTLAIRLAGFQIRDMITWHYGSGFPKSVNCGDGKGTALKPASEPICVARKPLEGTIYQNFKKYGIGVLNIDNCRIEFKSEDNIQPDDLGRFPANVIFDEYTSCILDEQSGILTSGKPQGIRKASNKIYGQYSPGLEITGYGDTGGASRFFYCAKASKSERNAGLEVIENFHPTVKPISLMRWLQCLVTPKGGLTLDPFAGSGTSGCSAAFEAINIVMIEMQKEYIPIIEARIAYWKDKANREKYYRELKESQLELF